MHRIIKGVLTGLALALLLSGQPATASIVYSVNVTGPNVGNLGDTVTGGTETVTGTITTDSTIGLLTSSNIIGWSLLASGAISAGVGNVDPNAVLTPTVFCAGCITATSTELDVTGTLDFQNADQDLFGPFVVTSLLFSPSGAPPPFSPLAFVVGVSISGFPLQTPTIETFGAASVVQATATSSDIAVPEPSSLSILGLGLVLFGFAKTGFHRRVL